MAYKLLFISLGCAKNLVDSEKMLEVLANYGFEFTDTPEEADAAVVNTCTFIDEAKSESIDNILDIAEYKKPEKGGKLKALIVAGCLVERYRENLYDEIPEIDAVLGVSNIQDIASVALWVLKGNRKLLMADIPMVRMRKPKALLTADNYMGNDSKGEKTSRISLTPPYWSYLKISDGCNNPCSFCVIPKLRGNFKSVPMDMLIARARRLADEDVREFNIIAQDTSNYGRDLYGTPKLAELLKKLSEIDKIKWLRVLYTYPLHVSDELIDVIASNPKVCNYIDVPLQHVTDNMLSKMRRGMTLVKTEQFVEKLREKAPDMCIRTSFIIGHPGETEKDVEALIEFIAKYKLDKVGFFRYSREEGTIAAEMPDQVPEKEKIKRLKLVSREYDKVLKEINNSLIGRELDFLIEDYDDKKKMFVARSYREAPEVDGYVYLKGFDVQIEAPGNFVRAKITKTKNYDLIAEAI